MLSIGLWTRHDVHQPMIRPVEFLNNFGSQRNLPHSHSLVLLNPEQYIFNKTLFVTRTSSTGLCSRQDPQKPAPLPLCGCESVLYVQLVRDEKRRNTKPRTHKEMYDSFQPGSILTRPVSIVSRTSFRHLAHIGLNCSTCTTLWL